MPGVKKTMEEFKGGSLHSGSKSGPVVKNPKQAIAIALSEKGKGLNDVVKNFNTSHKNGGYKNG